MKRRYYHTGQFARKASVTLRTLRYYDSVGLLSPSHHTASGYRLYSEEDLLALQQILALKFLGFSLEEIRHCLCRDPQHLESVLARQRAMLLDRRRQIDTVLKAIAHTESILQTGQRDWDTITRVIEEIQMEQKQEWMRKYFNDDQLQAMDALHKRVYSPEAQQKLAQRRAWTEQDQEQANAQWAYVAAEAQRLAAAGADPAGEEGQALAKFKADLLFSFTQGDPDIEAGLKQFWDSHNALPQNEQPLASLMPATSDAADQFLEKAMTLYNEQPRS